MKQRRMELHANKQQDACTCTLQLAAAAATGLSLQNKLQLTFVRVLK